MQKFYDVLLKQHIGSKDRAVIKVGDSIEKGALIAVPTGLGANIHVI